MGSTYDRWTQLARRSSRAISPFDVVAILAALTVGVGLRIGWAVRSEAEPVSDGEWYHVVAQSIVSGDGIATLSDPVIPTALFPPGYPVILAGAYKLFGSDLWVSQTVNIIAVAGTIVLTYVIGRMVFSRPVAAAGALILAIFPSQVLFTPLVMSELVFTLFFTAAVALLLLSTKATPRQTLILMAAAGLVAGAATLVRGQGSCCCSSSRSGGGFTTDRGLASYPLPCSSWRWRSRFCPGRRVTGISSAHPWCSPRMRGGTP